MAAITRLGPMGVPMPYGNIGPKLSTELKASVVHIVPAPEVEGVHVPAEDFGVEVPVSEIAAIIVPAEDPNVIVPEAWGGLVVESRRIQPSERKTAYFDFSAPLAISGLNLVEGGMMFTSDSSAPTTAATLQAAALEDADEITLDVNPRVGARLTINAGQDNEEVVKVTAVSGSSSPFTATILPILGFEHADNEPVVIERGTSAAMLTSTTPQIIGSRAYYTIYRPVHGHSYRTSVRVELDNGDFDEYEVLWVCSDD